MPFDTALRITEMLLGFAFLLQSLEHLRSTPDLKMVFAVRALSSALLLFGVFAPFALLALSGLGLHALHRFQGPYNGGADRMGFLILICLTLATWLPMAQFRETFFAYLGLQLVLSYFISGRVKLMNSDWRSGQALSDVFAFSAYPVTENLRSLGERPTVMWVMSWAVIGFEVLFPLSLISQFTLICALCLTACFHLANAILFGLNRFFWVWLAAYPALIWLQDRVIADRFF